MTRKGANNSRNKHWDRRVGKKEKEKKISRGGLRSQCGGGRTPHRGAISRGALGEMDVGKKTCREKKTRKVVRNAEKNMQGG